VSPSARSKKLLGEEGYEVGLVEQTIRLPGGRVFKRDLFGFADHAAVKAGEPGTLYVQTTSGSNHAARREKALSLKSVAIVLAAGNRVEIWSWSKRGARGKRKTWTARREPLSLSDFVPRGT
jgi:hypothetical protein